MTTKTMTKTMTKTTQRTTREALHALAHELKLKGMDRVLDCELDRAERNGTPPGELIERLLTEQASFQRERALANRVAHARLPWQWTIDTFPFERQSGVNKAQILGLAGLDFLRRTENLVLIGGPLHRQDRNRAEPAAPGLRERLARALLQRPDAVGRTVCVAG